MIIPTVKDEHSAYDICSRLLKERIILLTGEINSQVAEIVVADLLYLQAEDSKKPIYLYINSPGGSVTDGLAIIDTMHILKTPVYTYCVGQCASMGAVILAAGDNGHRYALENSRVMLHMVSSGTYGQILDMKAHVAETEILNEKLFDLLSKYTGKTSKQLKKDCERDNFMGAEEALEYGLVDSVLK